MKIFNINNIYKAIPKPNKSKLIPLYLNWLDVNSYIGEGKIIEMSDFKPIIFFDNPLIKNSNIYIRPRSCLCEIISSEKYEKGFKKHFIIPFKISEKIANQILLHDERILNKNNTKSKKYYSNNVISIALEYNNYLVDSIEEIEFSQKVLNIYKKSKSLNSENIEKIKNELLNNLQLRQENINLQFDKLYPEKANKLKKLRKRKKDEIII